MLRRDIFADLPSEPLNHQGQYQLHAVRKQNLTYEQYRAPLVQGISHLSIGIHDQSDIR